MSVTKNKRGRYEIAFMQSGRRIHRVCPPDTTKAQAVEWETKLRGEVFRVDKLGGLPEYSLAQAIQRYLNEYPGKDKKGVDSKTRAMAGNVGGASLGDIIAVSEAVSQTPGITRSTKNRRLAILRRVANLAYKKWGWLKEPLGNKIQFHTENPSREVFLTKAQIDQLAGAQENVQIKAAIYIAAYTGLRSGEILALSLSDVQSGVIHVKTSKTGKPRMVPIAPTARPWIKYLPIGLHPASLSRAVAKTMPGVRFHDLRHSCASLLLAAGVDLYTISKILGHSNIRMTSRYAHLETKALKTAMRKLK